MNTPVTPTTDPSPWVPMSNPVDLKHLGKLAEELGEASAAVARCMIQGIDGLDPETGEPNRIWLTKELADVLANIGLVVSHFGLDESYIAERARKKSAYLSQWHGMLVES